MKNLILIVLFLVSCSRELTSEHSWGATDPINHCSFAACDAPPAEAQLMGNLPDSRTITLTPDDPIPSNLINEIQDNIVGARRGQFKRSFQPSINFTSSGSFIQASNPVTGPDSPVIRSDALSSVGFFDIPFEDGETIIEVEMWIYGNASADLVAFEVYRAADMSTVSPPAIGTASENNVAATWHKISANVTPTVLSADNVLNALISVDQAGLNIGKVIVTFKH